MATSRRIRTAAVAAICIGLGAHAAVAGTIASVTTSSLPGASTGTIGPIGAAPSPNNDNVAGASPNVVSFSVFFNTLGPTQIEFALADSGGTTEYRFTQSFVNNTGQAWIGFEFELGFGLGDAFTLSTAADGLDFDLPNADPTPTASGFSVLSHQTDRIGWSGGSVPSVGALSFTFAIDVPDNLAAFHPGQVNRFTLRQTPIVAAPVPEPGTWLLLGAGSLALFGLRRRAARGAG